MCDPLTVGIITLAIAGGAIAKNQIPSAPTLPPLPPLPPIPTIQPTAPSLVVPEPEVIKEEARESVKKRLRRRTQRILTSPVGIEDEANIAVKTLLGG